MGKRQPSATRGGGASAPGAGRQAVIDIGSNSVRLVIYDGPRRAPMPVCNEKALCGLGRDFTPEGGLNPAAVDYALATLRRFRAILDEHDSPPTRAIATAAVREANDGAAFIEAIRDAGFDVNVIDGAEEARLSGLGVISCEPKASGLVGDMGGGSLELIALKKGVAGEAASLSIGPLRLMRACENKIANAPLLIDAALDAVPWIKTNGFKTIYSVGGAWRALARIHMRVKNYPLSVLHHYEFSKADALEICDLVARQSRRSLLEVPGLPHRRIDTLPFAAMVFKAVLKRSGAERVVVSAGGVREGLLFNDLNAEEKSLDPLMETARFFAERLSPDSAIGDAVAAVTKELFKDESPSERRVRLVACQLSDIGAYFHPDHRAQHAFETVLRGPFLALSHKERVAIAVALYCRHDGKAPTAAGDDVLSLLSPEEKESAVRLGLALRFCGALAPKAPGALAGSTLLLKEGKLVLRAPRAREALVGELPRKRLTALAGAFGVTSAEEYY